MTPLAVLAAPACALGDARVLVVDDFLGLDGHVDDVLLVTVFEFALYYCKGRVRVVTWGEDHRARIKEERVKCVPRRWLLSSKSLPK